ncbi:autophagy protein, variant 2 [Entomophthora muscae]|uniref:Autophagy protein, variant 2 n=1 Tax=Entomophthora muscae TaxID=34485 RepID=A0ACC2UK14_9FUNG|nr:autophagy protein, variant 2 [Entomophthora muscae]
MLFSTSLVALVGAGEQPAFSPRKLKIVNTKRDTTICELNFPTTVLSVKLNRRRMAIILEEQIYIYDISNMRLQHTIETSPNPKAICALSPSNENCYLAYPAPQPPAGSPFSTGTESTGSSGTPKGEVLVYDALSLQVINVIQAHKSGPSFLSINPSGTMLATASDKGTVIRVFSLPGAQKLYQFRRGTYAARIYSISFNMVSSLLCVSSDTDTVHIFRLGSTGKEGGSSRPYPDESSNSTLRRTSFQTLVGRKLVGSMGGYLPEALTEMWEPARDFAFLKLPSVGAQSIVALSR